MAQVVGQYTVLKKARINPADGTVSIVLTIVETMGGRVIADNIPANLAATVNANLKAVDGQYDVIGV